MKTRDKLIWLEENGSLTTAVHHDTPGNDFDGPYTITWTPRYEKIYRYEEIGTSRKDAINIIYHQVTDFLFRLCNDQR